MENETFWLSGAVGAFSITAWAYFEVGFVPSFLPLLVGIFALRRYLTVSTGFEQEERAPGHRLIEKYGIVPDREYTPQERLDVLSEIHDDYRHKRNLWGVLAALSAIVAALFVSTVPVVTAMIAGVATYCLLKTYRTHRLVTQLMEHNGTLRSETE